MTTDLYNTKGKKIDKIELPSEIFKAKINPVLMTQAVRIYLANQRQGTQEAKTRGEVEGSGKKIYRQKGTGNARHGDKYAPIFMGGGVAFPPKPRDFSLNFGKKMRRLALFSALTQKLDEKAIIVVEGLENIQKKTKDLYQILVSFEPKLKDRKTNILMVLADRNDSVILSARNIEGVKVTQASLLNTYSVLNSGKIIFLKDSLNKLSECFLKKTVLKKTAEIKTKESDKEKKSI